MSIERSIFNSKDEVSSFVQSKYGIEPSEVERLYGGSANCYRLTANDAAYFLKEFPQNFNKRALIREAKVCQMLAENGVPTSEFVKTLKSDDTCVYRGRIFHLQKFLDGVTIEKLSASQLIKSAEMLSAIHNALDAADFLKKAFPDEWFDDWTKQDAIDRHQKIIDELGQSRKAEEYKRQVAEACYTKMSLLRAYSYDQTQFKNLKRVNSHGDYNNLQLLWNKDGEEITAVVDFSSATQLPAVWEIIRSYTLGAKECEQGESIDAKALWAYVEKYLEKGELSLFDIENMLPFYYYNLLCSTYGLHLTSKSAFAFAMWRTKLCQYLNANQAAITQYLCEKYKQLKG